MKLALIGPEMEENLALRYIHASVVAAGHKAEIFDFHEEAQIPELARRIAAYRPAVAGMSMVFTARAREYVRLAEALREAGFKGHITAGGHFASFHAEPLLRDCSVINSVLHGEGERACVDLLENLREPWNIAGITRRDKDGAIVHTAPHPPLDDLDALPFPTRPKQFHKYFDLPIANMLSGRGCFANCDFCSIHAWHERIGGRRFRQRSVENLASEIAHLYYKRGVRILNFHDDNFFLPAERQNIQRFSAMRDALRARGIGRIGFQIKARPDSVHERSMRILKDMGLFRVFLGVESNSVAGLKALGRGITREQNARAVQLLKDLDLHVTFNLLMFEPECTLDDLRENVEFIRRHSDVPLNFCRTEVYSGTPLEARLRGEGRLEGDYFGYNYTMTHPRSQRAYELFREVFTPRNFMYDGMNLAAMKVDYYFHILKMFYPGAATRSLRNSAKAFIRGLNENNAHLLDAICDCAETADGVDGMDGEAIAETAQVLARARSEFDEAYRPWADQLTCEMQLAAANAGAGARRSSFRTRATAVAATAAAAAMIGTMSGCKTTHPCEMAPQDPQVIRIEPHPSEMAPTPNDGKAVRSSATSAATTAQSQIKRIDTQVFEMIAEPPETTSNTAPTKSAPAKPTPAKSPTPKTASVNSGAPLTSAPLTPSGTPAVKPPKGTPLTGKGTLIVPPVLPKLEPGVFEMAPQDVFIEETTTKTHIFEMAPRDTHPSEMAPKPVK